MKSTFIKKILYSFIIMSIAPVCADECLEFKKFGFEDELESCLGKKTTNIDSKLMEACKELEKSNPDRFESCKKKISSTDDLDIQNVKGCSKDNLKDTEKLAACISYPERLKEILSRTPSDKDHSSYGMYLNINNPSKADFKQTSNPDLDKLKSCHDGLKSKNHLAFIDKDNIFVKDSRVQRLYDHDSDEGISYQSGKKQLWFSKNLMYKIARNNNCVSKKCVLKTNVGGKIIYIKLSYEVPSPKGGFKNTHYLRNVEFIVNNYTPESDAEVIKMDSPKEYTHQKEATEALNWSLYNAVLNNIKADSLEIDNSIKKGAAISPEAYSQTKKSFETCIDLMTQMLPNSNETEEAERELLKLTRIYASTKNVPIQNAIEEAKVLGK